MKNIIFVENFREVTKLNGSLLCNVILHGTRRKNPNLLTQNFSWVKGYVLLKLKLPRGCKQKEYHEIYFVPAIFFFCNPLKLACVRQPSSTKPSFPTVHTTEAFGIYKVLDNRNSHHANGMVRAPLDAFTFKK